MRRARTAHPVAESATQPRDVEALERVLQLLDAGVGGAADADRIMVESLVASLGLEYGALWARRSDGQYRLSAETGPLSGTLAPIMRDGRRLEAGDGLLGAAVRTREPVLVEGEASGTTCQRWQAARAAGMASGCTVPVISEDGLVTAVLEYYGRGDMPFVGARAEKWKAIGRIAKMARQQAVSTATLRETLSDREAVTAVVGTIGTATDTSSAITAALDAVRANFGWAYGSFWRRDEEAGVLRFDTESGSAGQEFRDVTLQASFAKGVGLSGRAWKADQLVFVADLAELTDCVRAPAAQRAGVRSGVCFPVHVDGQVIGTMDFFTTETIELSASRRAALVNVQQLVSQRLDVLWRAEGAARNARDLLQTVQDLRVAARETTEVAAAATARSAELTVEVDGLSAASKAIEDVIKIITSIAGQTNLLALNATIEAARAGEAGRGFAVVANEVKELARATAEATTDVSEHVAGIQASSGSVATGIQSTAEIIGRLHTVQSRMSEVLEIQAQMASAFEQR